VQIVERAPAAIRGQLIDHLKRGYFIALEDNHPDAGVRDLFKRLDKNYRPQANYRFCFGAFVMTGPRRTSSA
jgi:hypothetical protein